MRLATSLPARLAALAWAAAALLAPGCSGPTHFANPRADLSTIQRVAVMPFENMSEERFAGEKVQRLFVAELLNSQLFEVVEPARVGRALREERVESAAAMTAEEVARVAKALKADGLFFGAVLDYTDVKGSSAAAPKITLQLRLVEGNNGTTVWSVTRHRSGTSVAGKLFGFAPPASTVVATEVVRDAIHTLGR